MNKLKMERELIITEKPPFPQNMLVELTNLCNHDCIFCAHKKMKRSKGKCSKEVMISIIKEAYDLGTREIGFYLTGEPFLNSDLEWYIENCKDLGFEYIYLTTNGVLATAEKVKKLYERGLSTIKFSINAATNSTYEEIHGRNDLDKVIFNLEQIIKMKSEGIINIPLFASFVKITINEAEADLFKSKFNKYFDDIIIVEGYNQGGNMPELNNGLIVNDFKGGINLPCEMIFNRIHITYEGYLNACCVDFDNMMAVADLKYTSLKEAWYSTVMIELRKEHMLGKLTNNMCYRCINNCNAEDIQPLVAELYERKD